MNCVCFTIYACIIKSCICFVNCQRKLCSFIRVIKKSKVEQKSKSLFEFVHNRLPKCTVLQKELLLFHEHFYKNEKEKQIFIIS